MSLRTLAAWSLVLLCGASSAIGSEFEIAAEAAGPPSAAVLASGDVVVAWAGPALAFGRRQPSLRVLDPEGVPRSQVVRLAPAAAEVDGPVVAALASGGAVAVWGASLPEASGGGVWAQRVGTGGGPIGDRIRVATREYLSTDSVAVAGLPDGGFVVLWTGGSIGATSLLGRPFDWRGDPAGPTVRLSSPGSGYRLAPTVAALTDGYALAVWENEIPGSGGSSLVVRRLDASGAPSGPEVELAPAADGWNRAPAISANPNGGAVLVWRLAPRSWPNGPQPLLAGTLDPSGELQAPPIEVDDVGRAVPSVAADSGGRFVVTWHAENSFGGSLGLRARGLAIDGEPLGRTFRLDPASGAIYVAPCAVASANGGFVALYGRDGRMLSTRVDAGPSAGTIRLLESEVIASELSGWAGVRLLRSGGSDGAVAVGIALRPITAAPGVDYDDEVEAVVLGDGDLEPGRARIRVLDDDAVDGTKSLELRLATADGGATLGEPSTALVTLADDDALPFDPGPNPLGPELPVAERDIARAAFAVTAAGEDRFLVSWIDDGLPTTVWVRAFDPSGNPLAPPAAVGQTDAPSSFSGVGCAVASDGVNAFVLWTTAHRVLGRPIDLSGLPTAPEVELAEGLSDVWIHETMGFPSVAPGGEGTFRASWGRRTSSPHDLGHWHLESLSVAADGSALSALARLPLGSAAEIGGFAVAIDSVGEQLVVVGRSGSGPWLTQWTADGTPRWRQLAETPSPGRPGVAVTFHGHLIVSWSDRDQSGYPEWSDVAARRIGSDGLPRGPVIRINCSTAGSQARPALTADATGVVTAIWTSSAPGPATVVGRRFNDAGLPLGGDFHVGDSTVGAVYPPQVASLPDGRSLVVWEAAAADGSLDLRLRAYAADGRDPTGTRPGSHRVEPSTASP